MERFVIICLSIIYEVSCQQILPDWPGGSGSDILSTRVSHGSSTRGGRLLQRVMDGMGGLQGVGRFRGGIRSFSGGFPDMMGTGSGRLTAGLPQTGTIFTRETVSVHDQMRDGTRTVIRHGSMADPVIDPIGRTVGGASGAMIGTSVFGDSARGLMGSRSGMIDGGTVGQEYPLDLGDVIGSGIVDGGTVSQEYPPDRGGVIGSGSGIVDRGTVGQEYPPDRGGVIGSGSGIVDRGTVGQEYPPDRGGVIGSGSGIVDGGTVGQEYPPDRGGVIGSGIVDQALTMSDQTYTGGPVGDILCPNGARNDGLCASFLECEDKNRAQVQLGAQYRCVGHAGVKGLSRRHTGICCRRMGSMIGTGTVGVGPGAIGVGGDVGLVSGISDFGVRAATGAIGTGGGIGPDIGGATGISDYGSQTGVVSGGAGAIVPDTGAATGPGAIVGPEVIETPGTGEPGSERAAIICRNYGEEPKFHANLQPDECTRRYNHCPGRTVTCRFLTPASHEGVCCEDKSYLVDPGVVVDPVVGGSAGYPNRGAKTVVDVVPVPIVGDRGVIGTGTAVITDNPDTPAINPVVTPVRGGIIDAGGSGMLGTPIGGRIGGSLIDTGSTGIIGSGPAIVDTAPTISDPAFTGGIGNNILCPSGARHEGFCYTYVQCEEDNRAQFQLGVRYTCIGNPEASRISRRTGICCREGRQMIGSAAVGVGVGSRVGSGMTDYGGGTGSVGVDPTIDPMVGPGSGTADYGTGTGVVGDVPGALGTDGTGTVVAVKGTLDVGEAVARVATQADTGASPPGPPLPQRVHRPRFHGETICFRLNERPYRPGLVDGRLGAMARCTMQNPYCPDHSVCRRTYRSHWGTCCVPGHAPTKDMLAAIRQ